MITLSIPEPNEKQKLFLRDTHKYIAYGGSRGGGKSWAVRVKAILLALNYAGIIVMIVRRSYPELVANHIKPMRKMLPNEMYRYNDVRKEIVFPNGSHILFRFCASEKDLPKFQGTETDVLFVDEATQFAYEVFRELNACVRGVNTAGAAFPKRTYLTCNPGGPGHQWVKRLFVDRRFEEGENPDDYSFIQAGVRDNKILMEQQPEYIQQLEALPPKLREAWLYGSWDVYEGQFFEEFKDNPEGYDTRQWSHVVNPFEITDEYTIYRSFDWGYNRPFSCMWWAVDKDGVLYQILELYGCTKTPNEGLKWTPDKVFTEIRKVELEHPWLKGRKIIGVADPACWNAEYGESIAETAGRHGVYFSPGDHERISGFLQMHYRMAFDENGYAMMYFFRNCKGTIRTLPLLMYDEHRPEDLDTDGEDHIADAARYMCMARPIKPRMKAERDPYYNSPLAQVFDIKKEDLTAIKPRARMEIIS